MERMTIIAIGVDAIEMRDGSRNGDFNDKM
jgi:hypothetical protein